MPTRRRHALVASASLCLLAGLPSAATAGVAIQLFNPYNHGVGAGPGNPGVNELGTDRVPIAHAILFPSLGDLGDTDYVNFAPFYVNPTTSVYMGQSYNLDNYNSYQVLNVNPSREQLSESAHLLVSERQQLRVFRPHRLGLLVPGQPRVTRRTPAR